MKQKSHVEMRMQLLSLGDRMGFPRLAYRQRRGLDGSGNPTFKGLRLRAGEEAWTAFAQRARLPEIASALRNAQILASYYYEPVAPGLEVNLVPEPVDEKRQRQLDNLAKARAARKAKRQEATA